MKYLRKFNESNDIGEINSTIEDILRDLEDNNIRIDINNWDGIEIFLTNKKEHKLGNLTAPDTFPYETIKPNIEHLVSFLKENGWRIGSIYNIIDLKPTRLRPSGYENLNGEEIGRLELRFVKSAS